MIKRIREWWTTPMVPKADFDALKEELSEREDEVAGVNGAISVIRVWHQELQKDYEASVRLNGMLIRHRDYYRDQLAEARSDKQATLDAVAKERASNKLELDLLRDNFAGSQIRWAECEATLDDRLKYITFIESELKRLQPAEDLDDFDFCDDYDFDFCDDCGGGGCDLCCGYDDEEDFD